MVRKSAIVWFAEAGVRRLSNDRVSRVMQTASLPERRKQVVKEVGRQIVNVGDWCLFKNVEETNYYLGKILSLAIMNVQKTKRAKVIWEWDGSHGSNRGRKNDDPQVGALCLWYEFERSGGQLSGKLTESNLFTHGFHSCNYYICSCPPPQFSDINVSSDLVYSDSIMIQLSSSFDYIQ